MLQDFTYVSLVGPNPEHIQKQWAKLYPDGWTHFHSFERIQPSRVEAANIIGSATDGKERGLIVAVPYRVPPYSKRLKAAEIKLEHMLNHMGRAPAGWQSRLAAKIATQRHRVLELSKELSQTSNEVHWLVGGRLLKEQLDDADHHTWA